MNRTLSMAAVAAAAALALTGCAGDPVVKKADLEKRVSQQWAAQSGKTPSNVVCPRDLKGKVGMKESCTVALGGPAIVADVTVTEVKGSNVTLKVERSG